MAMMVDQCFAAIARRRRDEIVVTSAGNSSEVWWETTGDLERTFYLEASMSLSTMFAAGLAMFYPERRFWAFLGDGAFVMNTGLLFVEKQMALANMTSIIAANRCYGSTDAVALPDAADVDFAAVARAAGICRVFDIHSLDALENQFDEAFCGAGPTTIVLQLEPPARRYESPPYDGPELKYLFGRSLERSLGRKILP